MQTVLQNQQLASLTNVVLFPKYNYKCAWSPLHHIQEYCICGVNEFVRIFLLSIC